MKKNRRLDDFVCWECGNCCRGEGFVRLCRGEAERIADYLGLSLRKFVQKFTKVDESHKGLILEEKGDDRACVFLNKNNSCSVYSVRPQQCKSFPYKWNYPGWWRRCANSCSLENKPIIAEKIKDRK